MEGEVGTKQLGRPGSSHGGGGDGGRGGGSQPASAGGGAIGPWGRRNSGGGALACQVYAYPSACLLFLPALLGSPLRG